jgi:hypothetical protein
LEAITRRPEELSEGGWRICLDLGGVVVPQLRQDEPLIFGWIAYRVGCRGHVAGD